MKFSGRKDGQFRSGGLLVGDRPFFVLRRKYESGGHGTDRVRPVRVAGKLDVVFKFVGKRYLKERAKFYRAVGRNKHRPDVALLDLRTPTLDGIGVIK